jgi:hypothetical protein
MAQKLLWDIGDCSYLCQGRSRSGLGARLHLLRARSRIRGWRRVPDCEQFSAFYIERWRRDRVPSLARAQVTNLYSCHCGGRWIGSGHAMQNIDFSSHNGSRPNDAFSMRHARARVRVSLLLFSIPGLGMTVVFVSVRLEGISHRLLSWFSCDDHPVCLAAERSSAIEQGEARIFHDHPLTYMDGTKCEDATSTSRSEHTFARRKSEDCLRMPYSGLGQHRAGHVEFLTLTACIRSHGAPQLFLHL